MCAAAHCSIKFIKQQQTMTKVKSTLESLINESHKSSGFIKTKDKPKGIVNKCPSCNTTNQPLNITPHNAEDYEKFQCTNCPTTWEKIEIHVWKGIPTTYYALFCKKTGRYISDGLNSKTLNELFESVASYFSADYKEIAAFLISPSNSTHQKINILGIHNLFLKKNTIPFSKQS